MLQRSIENRMDNMVSNRGVLSTMRLVGLYLLKELFKRNRIVQRNSHNLYCEALVRKSIMKSRKDSYFPRKGDKGRQHRAWTDDLND